MSKNIFKYIMVALGYLLVTGAGAVDSWLSLIQHLRSGQPVTINFGSWYDALFPVLGLAIIIFGIWWTSPRNKVKYWGQIKDDAIVGRGYEFFSSRVILSRHYTLIDRVKSAPTIWCWWHTGTKAWGDDAIKWGNIKRVILPHPIKAPIEQVADLVEKSPIDIAHEIIKLTNEITTRRKEQDKQGILPIDERIVVKWYIGSSTSAIMIGNPEPLSHKSWIQVEPLLPVPLENRPSFSLSGKESPFDILSEKIIDGYKSVWGKSVAPTEISEDELSKRYKA